VIELKIHHFSPYGVPFRVLDKRSSKSKDSFIIDSSRL